MQQLIFFQKTQHTHLGVLGHDSHVGRVVRSSKHCTHDHSPALPANGLHTHGWPLHLHPAHTEASHGSCICTLHPHRSITPLHLHSAPTQEHHSGWPTNLSRRVKAFPPKGGARPPRRHLTTRWVTCPGECMTTAGQRRGRLLRQ